MKAEHRRVELARPAERQRVIGAGDDFQLRARNLLREQLCRLLIARRVAIADDHERRRLDLAQATDRRRVSRHVRRERHPERRRGCGA